MQPDPTGSAAPAPEPDTAPSPADALATSEPTDAGLSDAEDRAGDDAAGSTPTPDDESAEDDGDDEGTETTGEQTEEQKRLSRKERQRLREQERIDKAVADAIAVKERERQEQAETAKREADAEKARAERAKKFAEYIGEAGEVDRLNSEIGDLNRRVRGEIGTLTQEQFDQIEADIRTKEARIASIQQAQGFEGAIREDIWNGIEAAMYRPLAWPEFADPATRQRFLSSPGGIAGAWDTARDVLNAAKDAERDAALAERDKKHAADKATWESELRTWRVRAGAEEVPDTTSGGAAAISDAGVLTPERYAAMSFEDRQKLRSTEAGRRQIDAMARGRTGFGQRSA